MSSVGQALGGIVGGAIGFFVGNPILGAQIGLTLGGLLDPPKVQGPRLQDLSAQTSTYGAFIPRLHGTVAVTGNVFWIQGDRLIERSVESGGKGGPSVTEFEYAATFAVGLCEGPIDGIRRIWIAGQLWYDAGSDDLATIIASNEAASTFTLYTGTDTQAADPLIQADRGAANVPAYRGLAYIVFDELPLKNYGNSLVQAQVKVEVINSGVWQHGRTVFGILTDSGPTIPESGAIVTDEYPGASYPYGSVSKTYSSDISGREWSLIGYELATPGFIGGKLELDEYGTATGFSHSLMRSPPDADLAVTGDFTLWVTHNARGHGYMSFSYKCLMVGCTNTSAYSSAGEWALVGYSGTYEFLYRDASLSLRSVSLSVPNYDNERDYRIRVTRRSGVLRMYIDDVLVDTKTGTDNTPLTGASYLCIGGYHDGHYLPNDYGSGSYVDVVLVEGSPATDNTVPLSTIVESECLQSDLLTAADLDVTELNDQVRGYRISSIGPLRGGIDPLRKAFPFDAIQHGYKIKFKKRGSASVATITEGELDAREAGAAPGVRVSNVREMDTVLPRQLTVNYIDATREYDTNTAEESRE